MSQSSAIEWTDATWNPTRGCSMAAGSNSPECGGCYTCYAARQALRHAGPGGAYEGLVKLTENGPRWTGKIAEGNLEAPLHWRKPRRIFVDSMSDLFHECTPAGWTDRAFAVMARCLQHTFQVLTKRADRMREYCYWTDGFILRFPHVWLGVSAETQATLDARAPHLLATPAAVRFLSLEPLLGPVDVSSWLASGGIHWVIVGGESGPGARRFDLDSLRAVIEQCKAAGVACFVKQLGARPVMKHVQAGDTGRWPWFPLKGDYWGLRLKSKKGGDMAEWPEWARVREYPR